MNTNKRINMKASRVKYAWELSKHIKGFGLYLFIAVVCNLLHKLLPLLTSLVTSYMVGSVLAGDTAGVTRLLTLAGVLVVMIAAVSYLDVQVSHDMAYRILAKLRDKCYAKLDELAPAALIGKRSGDMISTILNDVEHLEWFYAHTIGQIIVAVLVPAAVLVFMGGFSLWPPAAMLPFIALLIFVPVRTSRVSDRQGSRAKETAGVLNAIVVDGVQGLKDIISFRWQREFLERFSRANRDYGDAFMAYARRSGDEKRLITLITDVSALAVDMVVVALVLAGRVPAVWMLPLFVLSSAIFLPILDALSMSTNYGLIFGAAKRVLDLINAEPIVRDAGKEKVDLRGKSVAVAFEDVWFSYPGADGAAPSPVLRGLSFSLKTGETVALVGSSGGGKTTAARLLQRFWDADRGRVTLNGVDIRLFPLDELRGVVTVVPQEVYLFNMSVEDNLRLSRPDASPEDIRAAARRAQADGFIMNLPQGYQTSVGERGLRLSGGEKQRLSIAQAFLKNSPVLIMDEAGANLDAENERLINLAVEDLKSGRAMLVIAHRLSTIRSADRIVVMNDGRAEAIGTYEELLEACPYFRRLVGQNDGGDR